ncbi:hypothetical protein [uncultured Maribacter sp.]|uniref:hypothetical protein n=1 Tax=uncultured Maribacter sp. TaxID=431308 RepID=UPI002636E1C9|nr:hypothetical protein [uncultured Maribacter sp.]
MEPKSFLKTLSFLHLSLVIGLLLFSVIAYSQTTGITLEPESNNVFLYIVPVIAIIGYFGSQVVFKKKLSTIKTDNTLTEKLKKYKSASHIKFFLIEIPALLSIYAFYITSNALPLVIAVCLIAYLYVQKPSADKIKTELALNPNEIQQL